MRTVSRIKAIVDAGIVVCGHIGLTPQSSGQLGGHKAQGRTAESAELVIKDALAIQLLIVSDLVGQFQAFTPKFVKKYCDVADVYLEAFRAYIKDVKNNNFPEDQHCYHIIKREEENFANMIKKYE